MDREATYHRRVRLLFLAGRDPDYLQDALYHGLVTLLGAENVIEHPENERYHGAVAPDPRMAMLSFDFPRADRGDVADVVRSADAIIITSLRDSVIGYVRRVLELRATIPTVFVDGADDPYMRGIGRHVDAYFKRETLQHAAWLRCGCPLAGSTIAGGTRSRGAIPFAVRLPSRVCARAASYRFLSKSWIPASNRGPRRTPISSFSPARRAPSASA